ncbi:MAG: polysaccharide biosynthesis tyrosine autokinase [Bacteroidales bacterium]|nr:polysaccharide biosynthesis tyrosine autokinase [Bacteroidales bacterium]
MTTITRRIKTDDSVSIKDMLMICLRYWPWFVLSFGVIMGAVILYLLSTPPVYTRTASILVKSGSNRRNSEMRMYEELGVANLTSDINDEMVAIHSPAAVYDMVKRLHLDVDYRRKGFLRDQTLFANSLPVEVVFEDIKDNETASFTLKLAGDDKVTIDNMVFCGREITGSYTMKLDKRYKSPFGIITIRPALGYKKGMKDEIEVTRSSYLAAAGRFGSRISASLQSEAYNIIDIRCLDVNTARADNVLSTMINIYNENWVKNRNQISVATNEFIKERLAVIEQELGHVDKNISDYKSARAMPDVGAVAGQAMGERSATEAQSQQLNNQLYMVKYVRNYISDDSHSTQLLPASSGIGNSATEAQISEYNNKLLQRNNLVANSSEQNPLVQDMDVALKNMRSAILSSLDNEQATLNIQLRNVQAVHGQAIAKLSANPQQAKDLLSIERQQTVKESLYLFLLQKREENELSQAFTAYNTRIIANPYGSSTPTYPRRNNILLTAFAIALALPAAFFIIRETSNSKVRGRKDLEGLSLPFIGELPLWKPKKGEEDEENYHIVVKQHKRDLVNEAFRVARTNLEFMTNPEKKCKLIMLTSFNPGSGKTFICANMGASFSIRGSRVICIDLDMRRSSLSELAGSPKKGIADYLGGKTDDFHSVIFHHEESGVDFLPVGKTPPNPTELLYSSKLKPMLDQLRQEYDYVFVDCPPVEIVADATIISHESDITLFVVRAGMLERAMLPELEKNYEEKKYNNMAMILNGTDATNHYGYHRYGYAYGRYGYGYGRYGHRYGYGYYGYGKSKGKSSKSSKSAKKSTEEKKS